MEPRRTRGRQDEERTNRILIAAIAGFLLLTLVVVVIMTGRPYSNAQVSDSTAIEETAPAAPSASGSSSGTTSAAQISPSNPAAPTTASPSPAAAATTPADSTLPEQMARLLPGSRQMLVATGARLGSNTGTLEVYKLDSGRWAKVMSVPANFGKTGLINGLTRTSGHLNTPTGIWYLGGIVFGQHASPPANTKMPYRHITQNSWWSGQHDSTYNTWVESKSTVDGEHLADSVVQYEYALNTGYNSPPNPRVMGRGTAIFLHCSEPPGNALGQFTHGCIAISRDDMKRVFATLDPSLKPSFAIGTYQKGTPTSIYSY